MSARASARALKKKRQWAERAHVGDVVRAEALLLVGEVHVQRKPEEHLGAGERHRARGDCDNESRAGDG